MQEPSFIRTSKKIRSSIVFLFHLFIFIPAFPLGRVAGTEALA